MLLIDRPVLALSIIEFLTYLGSLGCMQCVFELPYTL